MAWGYEIDRDRGLVITSAWDSLDGAQVLEHQLQLQSAANFNPDFYQFIDFVRVAKMEMDLETLLIAQTAKLQERFRADRCNSA